MKGYSVRFQMKVLILQKKFMWFEYRYEEGTECFIRKTAGPQSERVHWTSNPFNVLKNDKAVSFCKHHKSLARHKQNLNIIKIIKKWERKEKGTVRTHIIEGNRNTNETERLQNRKVIKKLAKSVCFLTQKH